jgi:hypothetical protein
MHSSPPSIATEGLMAPDQVSVGVNNLLLVATANRLGTIDAALMSRMQPVLVQTSERQRFVSDSGGPERIPEARSFSRVPRNCQPCLTFICPI